MDEVDPTASHDHVALPSGDDRLAVAQEHNTREIDQEVANG